ncbi:MAG: PglZ domain-containing protein [Bacteroidota bacterium]|nr:PglZ domain-containing protein [Bacteroidota bacterium]
MKKIRILWTDDEIEFLKAHIIFLEEKGYEILTASNADDALKKIKEQDLDLVFLDENMPGRGGLDILPEIKSLVPETPVVMITKSEEENIMEEAIGAQIDDYLIKPVNPKQILLTIKKFIDQKKLVSEKTINSYQTEFGKIGILINQADSISDWIDIYKKLVHWELELEKSDTSGMNEVLQMQNTEATQEFSKFIKKNYSGWLDGSLETPFMSPDIFKQEIFPLLDEGTNVVFLLIDNLRYDQWKTIAPSLQDYFSIEKEELFCSILPTATQYARNAIFSGLLPVEIQRKYPNWWFNDDDDEGKNQYEQELLRELLVRSGRNTSFHYEKITNLDAGKKFSEQLANYLNHPLVAVVYNFVDMLSHARTDSNMIRELAADEKAYRSLTLSWFQNSYLFDVLKFLSGQNVKVVLTTDHGTIRVQRALKVIGDRKTSANLRYKTGRNLDYNPGAVFEIKDPEKAGLPKANVSSRYIFANNDDFFAYPNNYNHYVKYYKDTFQHGGISLQEMLIPLVVLTPKI